MGIDVDAFICFGVNAGEAELPWKDEDGESDFETWFCRLQGIDNQTLWDEYYAWEEHDPIAQEVANHDRVKFYDQNNPAWREALDQTYKDKRRVLEASPIEIIFHGTADYAEQIVAVKGTVKRAWLGDPVELEESDLWTPEVFKLESAKNFCEAHNIPFAHPTWLLCSYYGY